MLEWDSVGVLGEALRGLKRRGEPPQGLSPEGITWPRFHLT